MTDDIKTRLRKAQIWLNDGKCCGQVDADGTCLSPACIFGEALKTFWEAADRIEELEAENVKLRGLLDGSDWGFMARYTKLSPVLKRVCMQYLDSVESGENSRRDG